MEQYTITKIYKTDKDKQGNPLTANGRPYVRMSIKTAEHGEKWLSGFEGSGNKFWKEGDKVSMIVEQKGEYLNFSLPKGDKIDAQKIELVLLKLDKIALGIELLNDAIIYKRKPEVPTQEEEEINPDNIPF